MFPLRVLSLGAGVQSTTVLLMMLAGELEKPDHIVFADTGWEPQPVYEHLKRLKTMIAKAGIPFHMVSHGNIRQDAISGNRFASMPLFVKNADGGQGMIRRQCTADYKIRPLLAKQRELAGLKPGQRCKNHRITTVIGISYDEVQRMRDAAFPWIRNEYPLVDLKMTRRDCLIWCESRGFDRPPRSACIGCPFKSDSEWRALKSDEVSWADAVDFDSRLRTNAYLKNRFKGEPFLHRQMKPLAEVDLRTDEELGIQTLFDLECEGMCGL